MANRRPAMPSLITTLGGIIAAVCSRCQSQRNYEFAMDTFDEVVAAHLQEAAIVETGNSKFDPKSAGVTAPLDRAFSLDLRFAARSVAPSVFVCRSILSALKVVMLARQQVFALGSHP